MLTVKRIEVIEMVNGNGLYEITWEEFPPNKVEHTPWEDVKRDLEDKLAKMGLQIVIGDKKKPEACRTSVDGLNYIVVLFYKNCKEERRGIIAHSYEKGAETLYEGIRNEVASTRIVPL